MFSHPYISHITTPNTIRLGQIKRSVQVFHNFNMLLPPPALVIMYGKLAAIQTELFHERTRSIARELNALMSDNC